MSVDCEPLNQSLALSHLCDTEESSICVLWLVIILFSSNIPSDGEVHWRSQRNNLLHIISHALIVVSNTYSRSIGIMVLVLVP